MSYHDPDAKKLGTTSVPNPDGLQSGAQSVFIMYEASKNATYTNGQQLLSIISKSFINYLKMFNDGMILAYFIENDKQRIHQNKGHAVKPLKYLVIHLTGGQWSGKTIVIERTDVAETYGKKSRKMKRTRSPVKMNHSKSRNANRSMK